MCIKARTRPAGFAVDRVLLCAGGAVASACLILAWFPLFRNSFLLTIRNSSAQCEGGFRDACKYKVNVNTSNFLAISEYDFDNSGEPGPQAKGVNHLKTPLRQLHVTHRASSCATRGSRAMAHLIFFSCFFLQFSLKSRGARGIEPETFR